MCHHMCCHVQKVTPWDVEGADEKGVDYDKLIRDFGCSPITPVRGACLIDRLQAKLTWYLLAVLSAPA